MSDYLAVDLNSAQLHIVMQHVVQQLSHTAIFRYIKLVSPLNATNIITFFSQRKRLNSYNHAMQTSSVIEIVPFLDEKSWRLFIYDSFKCASAFGPCCATLTLINPNGEPCKPTVVKAIEDIMKLSVHNVLERVQTSDQDSGISIIEITRHYLAWASHSCCISLFSLLPNGSEVKPYDQLQVFVTDTQLEVYSEVYCSEALSSTLEAVEAVKQDNRNVFLRRLKLYDEATHFSDASASAVSNGERCNS